MPNCCWCSVAKSCSTLCDPMDCSTPGSSVLHCLLEFAQTHFHWVGDAIWPSHPLPPPSPLSSILPSIRVFSNESALPISWPKYWCFSLSNSVSSEYSGLTGVISLQSLSLKSLLQHHSLKHQFDTQLSLWSNSHICARLLKNHSFDYTDLCQQSDISAFSYPV